MSKQPNPKPSAPAMPSTDPMSYLRHELRTPLNQIIGYSEMLEEDAEQSGQTAFVPDLQKIQRAARNLLEVINTHLATLKPTDLPSPAPPPSASTKTVSPKFAPNLKPMPIEEPVLVGPVRSSRSLESEAEKLSEDFGNNCSSASGQRVHASHLLVVDDNEMNRDMLSRRLEREGYTVSTAQNGRQALDLVRAHQYDLVLLDIMMPELDGFAVLERMKADDQLRHIPVIMISALDQLGSVVRCIEIGAEDYLPKPFEPTLLRARIGACLEKKQLRDQEQRTYLALVESQKHLAAELAEAAEYVKSLLPAPLTGTVSTDWRFIPSTQLGGDAFGYHWLDLDHFAMYLLDVCGHGVGAALLSISVMNVLRSQSLTAANFRDPSSVLKALNDAFQMENQNNMYFTIWYGIFDRKNRRVVYASGGHPPAVLLTGPDAQSAKPVLLRTPCMVVGTVPEATYHAGTCQLGPFARLFLFSDGVYEIANRDGAMWKFEEFVTHLIQPVLPDISSLDRTLRHVQDLNGGRSLEDDFSLVEFAFS